MPPPNSISFDEVMGLLRGPVVREFESHYAAKRGYVVADYWGDSQRLTKELAAAQITRAHIEDILVSRADMLGQFWDRVLALPDDGEEWPEGEEPDPDDAPETIASAGPTKLLRGFSITAACRVYLLTARSDAELVKWLKFCRIPHHAKYAQDLRRMISECVG
jgi:hypothetical protein